MINLTYSLIIEATADPDYFRFYSPNLTGFTGMATPSTIASTRPAMA